jgi:hypothetical protein
MCSARPAGEFDLLERRLRCSYGELPGGAVPQKRVLRNSHNFQGVASSGQLGDDTGSPTPTAGQLFPDGDALELIRDGAGRLALLHYRGNPKPSFRARASRNFDSALDDLSPGIHALWIDERIVQRHRRADSTPYSRGRRRG